MQNLENGGDFSRCQPLPDYDGIEREDGTNRLIESAVELTANVTELNETHHDLINGRAKVIDYALDLLNHIVQQCIEVESE